ncbi:MAG: hypothetical protein LBB89_02380 [Treponema sp.]|jgi:hypothetical protein|nr:hypothetical protein [Treponema sp.]
MKNTEAQRKLGRALSGILAVTQVATPVAGVAALAVFLAGCPTEPESTKKDEAKVRADERIDFGTNLYTNVSSTKPLTDAQWVSVKAKLTTALDTAAKTIGILANNCDSTFRDGVTDIEFVESQEYKYKVTTSAPWKILFDADYVINASASDLLAKVTAAVNAVNGSGPLQAKAIDSSRETVRMAKVFDRRRGTPIAELNG